MKKYKIKKPVTKGIARVPLFIQQEIVECGAASLCMIMAYYGKWISLEQARIDCGVSRDGSSAKNIIKAARNHGFQADAFKAEPDDLKRSGSFPCIIHWNMEHFVVLNGFKGNKAYISDPAMGCYEVSMQEFDESFTGICILISPDEAFVPSGQKKSMAAFIKKRMRGNRNIFIFVTVCTVITSLLGLIYPAFNRVFLDRLLDGKNPNWFLPFMTGFIVFCFIEILVALVNALYGLKLDGKLDADGNTSYFWKVLHLPMNFFSQRLAGDIRVRQDYNSSIAGTLINLLSPLAIDSAMLIFYLVVMIKNSWVLTLIGVSSIAINITVSLILSKRIANVSRVKLRDQAQLQSTTSDSFELIETIKATGAEDAVFEKWAGLQDSVYDYYEHEKKNFLLELIPDFVLDLSNILVMTVGAYLIIGGEFTIGAVMAFQGYLTSFMDPAVRFIDFGESITVMRSNMERIDDVMEYKSDDIFSKEDATGSDKLSGNIEMKNVTFGYSPLAKPLIRDFSLTIRQGMYVAIVGGSGCGKSTLGNLISGLYKPWSGEILFDGKPMSEIGESLFHSSLAVVNQDIVIFEDTFAENIKLWDESIEDFEMIMAARDARVHEDIIKRRDGYKGRLTEGGSNFSGGQCQRLEIARVLAQDPTIMIMDEATSALDAKTEFDVVKSIRDRGITSIVIAHRLSTIRDADMIIVIDHGEIVGTGTHEELMETNEYYSSLVSND